MTLENRVSLLLTEFLNENTDIQNLKREAVEDLVHEFYKIRLEYQLNLMEIDLFIKNKKESVSQSNLSEFVLDDEMKSARTRTKALNRNLQMKLNIVNNEPINSKEVQSTKTTSRLSELKDHLNINTSGNTQQQLKFVENHLIQLESKIDLWLDHV
jgi:hypothetical protein